MDIRQLAAFCVTVLLAGIVVFQCKNQKKDSAKKEFSTLRSVSGRHHVRIKVKNYGMISVELYADEAPITVTNFISLVKRGFYNGLTFHRVIDGFMIQGGDPNHNGTGGSEQRIRGEFPSNGINNQLLHKRGAISMARSQNADSASSQFFLVQQDSSHLDGDYAVFGYVTDGMEVVDRICKETKIQDNDGTVAREDQPVIEEITMID